MTVGGDVTPRVFCQDNGAFTGTYTQVPLTSTNYADKTGSGNYIVFNGLTNDAILIQNVEPVGDYQAGKLFGFQIVATPPVPLTTALQISPNPAYALSPVTLRRRPQAQHNDLSMANGWWQRRQFDQYSRGHGLDRGGGSA